MSSPSSLGGGGSHPPDDDPPGLLADDAGGPADGAASMALGDRHGASAAVWLAMLECVESIVPEAL